jgi:23S rRNA (adenine2030-N6)-methyltransferase
LLELHPRALAQLRRHLGADPQVHIHKRDCFEGLPALVPPPERRGLVLVDPSYEVKDDFARVAGMLTACHGRWPGGVYLVWYPLISDRAAERFPGRIAATGIRRIYRAQLRVTADAAAGMRGSGLLILNLPYGMDAQLNSLMPWLHRRLAEPGCGEWQAGWLVPE